MDTGWRFPSRPAPVLPICWCPLCFTIEIPTDLPAERRVGSSRLTASLSSAPLFSCSVLLCPALSALCSPLLLCPALFCSLLCSALLLSPALSCSLPCSYSPVLSCSLLPSLQYRQVSFVAKLLRRLKLQVRSERRCLSVRFRCRPTGAFALRRCSSCRWRTSTAAGSNDTNQPQVLHTSTGKFTDKTCLMPGWSSSRR